jgi:hypothetical protein
MNFRTLSKNYAWPYIYTFLTLIPIIVYITVVWKNSVDIPFWDEWLLADLRLKAIASSVSIQEIFALHSEHRIVPLKLISLIIDEFSTDWNSRLRMLISCPISIFGFFLVTLMSWQQTKSSVASENISKNFHIFGLTTVFTSILWFFPSQHENWLWGFQIPWFLMNMLLVSAIFLLLISFKNQKKRYYFMAILMCVVASFTLAQGLFTWIACLPMFLTIGQEMKTRLFYVGIWLGASVLTVIAYMTGYVSPDAHPVTQFSLSNLETIIDFFFNVLGNVFGQSGTSRFLIGSLILLAFVSLIITCFREKKVWNDALPWISIGLFAIIFAAMTTIGRVELGSSFAYGSRYATITLLLPIGALQLLRINTQKMHIINGLTKLQVTGLITLGFMLSSMVNGCAYSLADLKDKTYLRYRGKVCVELYQYLEESFAKQCIAQNNFPNPNVPVDRARALQDLEAIKSAPVNILSESTPIEGKFDVASVGSSNLVETVTASGWVFSDGQPGVVLLRSDTDELFFAVADVRNRRRDVASAYSRSYLNTGWAIELPLDTLPANTKLLIAYFYDIKMRKICKIGEMQVQNEVEQVKR